MAINLYRGVATGNFIANVQGCVADPARRLSGLCKTARQHGS